MSDYDAGMVKTARQAVSAFGARIALQQGRCDPASSLQG